MRYPPQKASFNKWDSDDKEKQKQPETTVYFYVKDVIASTANKLNSQFTPVGGMLAANWHLRPK